MSSDILGGFADLMVAIVIMFIIPVQWADGTGNGLRMKYAAAVTEEFVEDVCHHGGVSRARYEAYQNRLAALKTLSFAEMRNTATVYEPLYEGDLFTGEIAEYESVTDHDTIADGIYGSGRWSFRNGSIFEVILSFGGYMITIGDTVTGN